jgi:hypothetical protein
VAGRRTAQGPVSTAGRRDQRRFRSHPARPDRTRCAALSRLLWLRLPIATARPRCCRQVPGRSPQPSLPAPFPRSVGRTFLFGGRPLCCGAREESGLPFVTRHSGVSAPVP